MNIQYGAKVIDKNGNLIGTVDYLINDTLTGDIKKFKVKTNTTEQVTIFSIEDVAKATPSEVTLR